MTSKKKQGKVSINHYYSEESNYEKITNDSFNDLDNV